MREIAGWSLRTRPHLLPSLVAVGLLLGALVDNPYGYYVFLRWVVCASALFVIWAAYNPRRLWALWIFGIIAVLFNPVVPIHAWRGFWIPVDVVVAILFAIAIVKVRRERIHEN